MRCSITGTSTGGSGYGIARGVRLRGVRVLNCSGSGSTSGIIAAVDWVRINRVNPSSVNTTAASTSTDAPASYSNYGSCVDGYAPGSSIASAWIGSTTAIRSISGTSMASPHVAGVAALYKGTFGNASSSTIVSWINSNATANAITGNVSGTPNRLLYKSTL